MGHSLADNPADACLGWGLALIWVLTSWWQEQRESELESRHGKPWNDSPKWWLTCFVTSYPQGTGRLKCHVGGLDTFLFWTWWQRCPTESAQWLHHRRVLSSWVWISISLGSTFSAPIFISAEMEGLLPAAWKKRYNPPAAPLKGHSRFLKRA